MNILINDIGLTAAVGLALLFLINIAKTNSPAIKLVLSLIIMGAIFFALSLSPAVFEWWQQLIPT